MTKFVAFFLLIGLFVFPTGSSSSEFKAKKVLDLIKDFDVSLQKLPPEFLGHDIAEVYERVIKKYPKKSEYETLEEFTTKIKASQNFNRVYAFKIDGQVTYHDYGNETLNVTYNAEQRYFELTIRPYWRYEESLNIKTVEHGRGTYIGSNVFGVKKNILKYTGSRYLVLILNTQSLYNSSKRVQLAVNIRSSIGGSLKQIINMSVQLPSSPSEAKLLKDNIGVLLISNAGYPFDKIKDFDDPVLKRLGRTPFLNYDREDPTIDRPFEFDYYEKYIPIEIMSIWIYNTKTGDILLKEEI